MKKFLSVFAIITVLLAAGTRAHSQGVSVDYFYDNLDGGSWLEVGDYGYCWQPDVAANDPTWRPYADGYWAYTDEGWTWISYEDFGWATYHYGRWVKLADYGWVWKPGYEWGPAWVSWRTGGNYIGWAPLPPETEAVYESRPLTGHLDVEFDIGPAYYNFCDVRYIGEPVLRSRLVPYQENVTYVTKTVNVTNITYKNKTVYNYGPDINVLNQYSSRPIQRLKLERQTNVDAATAAKGGGLTKVQGNALVVAAPMQIAKPAQPIAPRRAKAKVAQAKVEKGWAVAGDPSAQTQLKEKLKSEDLKSIPPPTLGVPPNAKASVAPGASGAPGSQAVGQFEKGKGKNKNKPAEVQNAAAASAAISPGQEAAQFEKGKGKNKNKAAQMQNAEATGTAGAPVTNPEFPERGKKNKHKNAGLEQPGSTNSPALGADAETSPNAVPDAAKPGKANKLRRAEQLGATSPAQSAVNNPDATSAAEAKAERKRLKQQNAIPAATAATGTGENVNDLRGRNRKFPQQPSTESPAGQLGGNTAPAGGAKQQSISDEPSAGMKNKRFERQPQAGPPPSSQVGAPGTSSNTNMAPQGGAVGGDERGKRKAGPAGPAGADQTAGGAQQAGAEPKREGKNKRGESPAPTPQ